MSRRPTAKWTAPPGEPAPTPARFLSQNPAEPACEISSPHRGSIRFQLRTPLKSFGKTFGLIFILCVLLLPSSGWGQPALNTLTADSVLLVDPHGRILYSKNAEGGHAPASLVKLMTLYLAFEALDSESTHWDEEVVVSAYAARTPPYRLGLRAGEKIQLGTLLQGVAIASANDAATAVAEHLAGSEEAFVARMNEKAAELGLINTHYANPHGLPALHQQTTAQDIARLTDLLLQNYPASRELLAGKSFVYRGRVFQRHILLDQSPDGMQAVKTGYTQASGYNLAIAAYRGSQRFLCVLLGSETRRLSFLEARKLLQFGFLQNGFHTPSDPPRPAKKTPRHKAVRPSPN